MFKGLLPALVSAFVLMAFVARAACPAPPDHQAALNDLHAALADAPGPGQAQAVTDQLWPLWLDAPDAVAQEMLDDGMERRRYGDLLGSIAVLDRLVAYCPEWAESWNQRAFSRFLAGQFSAARADLDRALALNPRHLGALTGRAMTLLALEEEDAAYADLRRALALNPWLAERELLPGEDI